eukprot:COSAG01_NODE_14079_length_1498_cov_7.176555_1_plen_171_part_00
MDFGRISDLSGHRKSTLLFVPVIQSTLLFDLVSRPFESLCGAMPAVLHHCCCLPTPSAPLFTGRCWLSRRRAAAKLTRSVVNSVKKTCVHHCGGCNCNPSSLLSFVARPDFYLVSSTARCAAAVLLMAGLLFFPCQSHRVAGAAVAAVNHTGWQGWRRSISRSMARQSKR